MRIMKMRDVKMRPIFLLIVSILPMMAHAQWTEQDSLRLQEFLSGKEEIRSVSYTHLTLPTILLV